MRPARLGLAMDLARRRGVLDAPGVRLVEPSIADDGLLRLIHDQAYIGQVRAASLPGAPSSPAFGLGTPDNPLFTGMHAVSALIAGASIVGAAAVWRGEADHAVNLAGGLHHAQRAAASGFCVYNDAALAIAWLLSQGAERVAYVDADVHHGDGVQAAFYDDPRVLTVSLHESGTTLFPGTGFPDDVGTGTAAGTSVNVALPAGTGDSGWLRAFHAVVPPLLRHFRAEVLVTQHGCDTHLLDPLAHFELSVGGQIAAAALLHRLAHETSGGRWLALGGGGYEPVRVVAPA
ncbi:MAG: acetoin utilization protein AcuC, partial [Actinomycetota bacterium]|nr:acetoin utilization protein AcuC [Actinomycetota bacterium]